MPVINRRQLLLGSLSLPLLALPSAGRAQVQTPRVSFESLLRPTVHSGSERWELTQRMSHYGVPGVAVAILRDGRTVSLKGYGSRLAGQDFPVGPDTLFSVGSVSKVATAALCLKLVALGKLDLDQGVGRWLRRWQSSARTGRRYQRHQPADAAVAYRRLQCPWVQGCGTVRAVAVPCCKR